MKNFVLLCLFSILLISPTLKAQDTNKVIIEWWIYCKNVGSVALYTDTLTEGKVYTIKSHTLPNNYSQAQDLYNAIAGSSYGFEYGSLNEDVKAYFVLNEVNCSQGTFELGSNNIKKFLNIDISIAGHSGTYNLNGKHFFLKLYKTLLLNNFLTKSLIPLGSSLLFAYEDNGLNKNGIKTLVTENSVEAYVEHFSTIVGVEQSALSVDDEQVPNEFSLKQNYPNPFNPSTTIEFSIPVKSKVELNIYNVLGSKVAVLVNHTLESGNHSVQFDASMLNSGVYVYELKTGSIIQSKKMILVK